MTTGEIHHLQAERFDRLVPEALANVELRGALALATDKIRDRRAAALAGVDLQSLRSRATDIRRRSIERLDEHLERFERAARERGTRVHWAPDAAAARRVVLDIAQRHEARIAVKSKSMVTEEIGLNDGLIDAGIVPIETDLGEWILQLADEPPSHILVPAIHRRRHEIRAIFAKALGREMPEDAESLTAIARGELRSQFLRADLGISGGNFLVAETGSILLIENEGNIRLTTSLPRVHIAVVGIEKVVPTLADLGPLVRVITRSGTGQAISCYQTLVTGPKASPEDEGPDELHVVLVDNGRSGILEDAKQSETLRCIRCSACLNVCPVYRQIGGHAYGSVYPGPIGAILTPQIAGPGAADPLPHASSLCGACREVCPVDIDIPGILLHLREREAEESTSAARRARLGFGIWSRVMRSPRFYGLLGRFARASLVLAERLPASRRWMGPLRAWSETRGLPKSEGRSFRSGGTARRLRNEGGRRGS